MLDHQEFAITLDEEAARPIDDLARRLGTGSATVAVLGLGYVGMPLLVAAGEAGYPVIGYDVDAAKVDALRRGRSYLLDVDDVELEALCDARYTDDPAVLREADVLVICVPTPLTDHEPDLRMVRDAAASVATHLRPGQLVILESTTYPGTTEDVVRPILEATGLRVGHDVALAYSPERIDPGQRVNGLRNTPKVVSGVTPACRELAATFYGRFVGDVVVGASTRDAEMAKLVENTFRQVNIALVNELAIHAREIGVDVWEALRLAGTKPFGYMPFWPGPGVGGHCIAIDPSYLSWRVGREVGYGIRFIEHANEVNRKMPAYVVDRIGEALNDVGHAVRGARMLVLGVAYKASVGDVRESPSLDVMTRLIARGADVSYHDPFVSEVAVGPRTLRSVTLTDATLADQDAVVILTAHPGIDYVDIVERASLVFDARGVTARFGGANVVRL